MPAMDFLLLFFTIFILGCFTIKSKQQQKQAWWTMAPPVAESTATRDSCRQMHHGMRVQMFLLSSIHFSRTLPPSLRTTPINFLHHPCSRRSHQLLLVLQPEQRHCQCSTMMQQHPCIPLPVSYHRPKMSQPNNHRLLAARPVHNHSK